MVKDDMGCWRIVEAHGDWRQEREGGHNTSTVIIYELLKNLISK